MCASAVRSESRSFAGTSSPTRSRRACHAAAASSRPAATLSTATSAGFSVSALASGIPTAICADSSGARSSVQASAADAKACGSATSASRALRSGTRPRRRHPRSRGENASGGATATPPSPIHAHRVPRQPIVLIGLTPPGMPRNCDGGFTLQRPHRQHHPQARALARGVAQRVARHRARLVAAADGRGLDVEREAGVRPANAGDGKVTLAQAMLDAHVGPGDAAPHRGSSTNGSTL
jgi:hypothetical protein